MKIEPYNVVYANFVKVPDRRQQNVSVDVERRSGVDRRTEQRYLLAPDQKLNNVDSQTQFIKKPDRRQQNTAVDTERRSGVDRRTDARFIPLSFSADNNIDKTKEIYVGKILSSDINFYNDIKNKPTSLLTQSKINSIPFDTFISSGKLKDIGDTIKPEPKPIINETVKKATQEFLTSSVTAVKKTAEVFQAAAAIFVSIETIKKIMKTKN